MTDKKPNTKSEHQKIKKDMRQERLNQALRDNLKRRKAQTRKVNDKSKTQG